MAKRLTFKGEAPKKKKKKIETSVKTSILVKDAIDEFESSQIEQGWTSATCSSDINGPIIIANYLANSRVHLESKPFVLAINEEDNHVVVDSDLDIIDQTKSVNFPILEETKIDVDAKGPYLAPIHRVEPVSVNQVFTVVSLSSLTNNKTSYLKTTECDQASIRVAFKTYNGKYLSLNEDHLDGLAGAIGGGETFDLKRVIKSNSGVWWEISVNGSKVIFDENKHIRCVAEIKEDGVNETFVLRVQTKNSLMGKRIINEKQEKQDKKDSSSIAQKQVEIAIKDLTKVGLSVDEEMINRLNKAARAGSLTQQVVEEKIRKKTDHRC